MASQLDIDELASTTANMALNDRKAVADENTTAGEQVAKAPESGRPEDNLNMDSITVELKLPSTHANSEPNKPKGHEHDSIPDVQQGTKDSPLFQGPNFTFSPSLAHHNITPAAYFASNPSTHVLATGVAVFGRSHSGTDHLLLVQRSPHDSYPNLWEVPGGSVDLTGETILEAAARELKEEAGLTVRRFVAEMWRARFSTGRGERERWWDKFTFVAEVAEGAPGKTDEAVHEASKMSEVDLIGAKVKLDENEHQAWLWASEEDVRNDRCGDVALRFVNERQKNNMLAAFEYPPCTLR